METKIFKSGFVTLAGLPNAGKSTLLNQLIGEKLAIVSHKVQTTRHKIMGIHNTPQAQIVFFDTPGIIEEPIYKLHERMMQAAYQSVKDADAVLFIWDPTQNDELQNELFVKLKSKKVFLIIINKKDKVPQDKIDSLLQKISAAYPTQKTITISALENEDAIALIPQIEELLPIGEPYYPTDELSDKPVRFFVSEIIREQLFLMYHEEIPYHTAVVIHEFSEKTNLTRISAEIIVQRETQKGIIIGKGGTMLKQLGTAARGVIEDFIGRKVYLELHIKVRPKWRDSDSFLNEYGY